MGWVYLLKTIYPFPLIKKEFELNCTGCADLWVEMPTDENKKCVSGIIYRHTKQKQIEFHKAFERVLDNLNNKKILYYIGGDFNIDLIKHETNNLITQFVDLTYSLSCTPLITQPTQVTSTSTTLIDHVYTNNAVNAGKSFILVS